MAGNRTSRVRINGEHRQSFGTIFQDQMMLLNLADLQKVRVLVIGDAMLDRYIWGRVARISPEAPVPVVKVESQTYRLGGAANVAANLAGLGCHVRLLAARGTDASGQHLSRL